MTYFLIIISRTYKSTSLWFLPFFVRPFQWFLRPSNCCFLSFLFFFITLLDVLDVSGHIHIRECQVHYEMDDLFFLLSILSLVFLFN